MLSIHRSKPIKLLSVNVIKYTKKKKRSNTNLCGEIQVTLLQQFITKTINKKSSKDEK